MNSDTHSNHPLYDLFFNQLRASSVQQKGSEAPTVVSRYLTELLLKFMHVDQIFAVRTTLGEKLFSITDMLAEADILVHAESFERERVVHKHIGDYILFWLGLNPDFLGQLRKRFPQDWTCDYPTQASTSYLIASQFDYPPHEHEALVLQELSQSFNQYTEQLRITFKNLPGLWPKENI